MYETLDISCACGCNNKNLDYNSSNKTIYLGFIQNAKESTNNRPLFITKQTSCISKAKKIGILDNIKEFERCFVCGHRINPSEKILSKEEKIKPNGYLVDTDIWLHKPIPLDEYHPTKKKYNNYKVSITDCYEKAFGHNDFPPLDIISKREDILKKFNVNIASLKKVIVLDNNDGYRIISAEEYHYKKSQIRISFTQDGWHNLLVNKEGIAIQRFDPSKKYIDKKGRKIYLDEKGNKISKEEYNNKKKISDSVSKPISIISNNNSKEEKISSLSNLSITNDIELKKEHEVENKKNIFDYIIIGMAALPIIATILKVLPLILGLSLAEDPEKARKYGWIYVVGLMLLVALLFELADK